MPIALNTTFLDGADLPSGKSFAEQLTDLSTLAAWFQADASEVTLSTFDIATMTDKKGGAGVLTSIGVGNRAVLTAGLFGDYTGAAFASGDADCYDLSGITFAQSSAFSIVFIGKLPTSGADAHIVGRYQTATARSHIYKTSTNEIRFAHGSGTQLGAAMPVDTPFLAIASFDGTYLHFSVNGVRSTDRTAAGSPSAVAFTLGDSDNPAAAIPMSGSMADVMLFNADIHANAVTLDLVKNFGRRVYGISVQ